MEEETPNIPADDGEVGEPNSKEANEPELDGDMKPTSVPDSRLDDEICHDELRSFIPYAHPPVSVNDRTTSYLYLFTLQISSNDQLAIFDLDEHNRLLFDDDMFSRSRRYFVISSIEEFKDRITDAEQQWERFCKRREEGIRTPEKAHIERLKSSGIKDPFFAVNKKNKKLKGRPRPFRVDDVIVELFNASSVVESRAATQLGENIRLLTYVSIFYLPLGYSAALWSINEKYRVPNLAITSVFIALGTYAFVSNMNNVVFFSKKTFGQIKDPTVNRMKRDGDKKGRTALPAFQPSNLFARELNLHCGISWSTSSSKFIHATNSWWCLIIFVL
ncbi:hypothetical protein AJ79_07406 [Helicocarpus griseus UAMH5409]|uniref:Uncharacterized protein n=1 Tax=Helicocarpus griseus UAMH5409 TaxID=1447875 RepID=A0A2B7X3R9_9EURO|nr:hypothetical protein AJ79_07406 [Helicocarpus griseus UAMH5409]